jgi:hypothetical protein
MIHGNSPVPEARYLSLKDKSVWKFKMLLLTPSRLVINRVLNVRLERITEFGEIRSDDVLEIVEP